MTSPIPEYWPRYNWMRSICHNPNHPDYYKYGGRGIDCHWQRGQYKEFEQWLLTTLGPRPSLEHCLSRKDKEKGFYPKNLEWALPKQRSRSHTQQNVYVRYKNKSKPIVEWAEEFGIPYHSFRRRVALGMPIKDIVKEFRNA